MSNSKQNSCKRTSKYAPVATRRSKRINNIETCPIKSVLKEAKLMKLVIAKLTISQVFGLSLVGKILKTHHDEKCRTQRRLCLLIGDHKKGEKHLREARKPFGLCDPLLCKVKYSFGWDDTIRYGTLDRDRSTALAKRLPGINALTLVLIRGKGQTDLPMVEAMHLLDQWKKCLKTLHLVVPFEWENYHLIETAITKCQSLKSLTVEWQLSKSSTIPKQILLIDLRFLIHIGDLTISMPSVQEESLVSCIMRNLKANQKLTKFSFYNPFKMETVMKYFTSTADKICHLHLTDLTIGKMPDFGHQFRFLRSLHIGVRSSVRTFSEIHSRNLVGLYQVCKAFGNSTCLISLVFEIEHVDQLVLRDLTSVPTIDQSNRLTLESLKSLKIIFPLVKRKDDDDNGYSHDLFSYPMEKDDYAFNKVFPNMENVVLTFAPQAPFHCSVCSRTELCFKKFVNQWPKTESLKSIKAYGRHFSRSFSINRHSTLKDLEIMPSSTE